MAEFKIDADGVKYKKVRWFTKRRKTKSRMWRSKWVAIAHLKPGTFTPTPPVTPLIGAAPAAAPAA